MHYAPTPIPTSTVLVPTVTQTQPPAATATATAPAGSEQQFTPFSDMHKLFSAEVPSDWIYSSAWVSYTKSGAPPDTLEFVWTSSDQHAAVVFLEFDDNQKVASAQLGDSAVKILNRYFVKSGDSLTIAENNPLPDGSVHLSWKSVVNKTQGTTYAYERGTTIIVLSTVVDVAYPDAFVYTFAHITSSYTVP